MRMHVTSIGTAIVVGLAAMTQSSLGQQTQHKSNERIGIYDSRAIAVAYAGSTFQEKKLKDLTVQLKKAKEAGDAQEALRLEAKGRAWQMTLHSQGFGTAPVDDILVHIANDLPEIQETAGVTSLISKWDKAELDKHPKADRVDVTMRLVAAFRPTETQRKRAIEIQKKSPVRVRIKE